MSVLVITKFRGDTDIGQQTFRDRADDLARIGERGRAAGCLHHRFGVGDGFIVAVDEWESAESFEKFIEDPEIQNFIMESGADPVPPQVIVAEAISTADQF